MFVSFSCVDCLLHIQNIVNLYLLNSGLLGAGYKSFVGMGRSPIAAIPAAFGQVSATSYVDI